MENNLVLSIDKIKSRIYTIRGMQVILDKDLSEFYNVKTKRLNEQVRRNITRFPLEFMFQLTNQEFDSLRSQFATSNKGRFESLRSQFVTLNKRRGTHRKWNLIT